MNRIIRSKLLKFLLFCVIATLSNLFLTEVGNAQFVFKWLAAGDLHNRYWSGGAWPEEEPPGMEYPGIYDRTGHLRSQGLWIATTNWNSEGVEDVTQVYPVKVVHRGPREQGFGQFYALQHKVSAKFSLPEVKVDGLVTFDKPVTIEEVDPDLKSDMMIHNVVNSAIGITMDRKIMQFSNEYHDNYHLFEFTFTNTGNVDEDEEVELPDQTLTGVYIAWVNRWMSTYKPAGLPVGVAWGRNAMNDVVGDGNKTYDRDFRASYTWGGHLPSHGDWNTIGAPQITNSGWFTAQADTVGRLAGSSFFGRVTIHADTGPDDPTDDESQPSTTNYVDSDDPVTSRNDQFDTGVMQDEYELISAGNVFPMHADRVVPPADPDVLDPEEWKQRFANQTARPDFISAGGFQNITSYGPYTLAPGQSVRIVAAEGADGISWEKNYLVGAGYKAALNDVGHPGASDVALDIPGLPSRTKNEWVMTGRDSLLNTFEAAIANYESGYNIPEPPRPPQEFLVNSRPNRIELQWTTFPGEDDPVGWEVYRARSSVDSFFTRIAELPGTARSYDDETAVRTIDYYYYLQAVGDEVTDDITFDPPRTLQLRSNRYYTQTYAPARLKRDAGARLSDVRVVPNPLNLAADRAIRYEDQNRLSFLNVPGNCTIKIYTEAGELLQTIMHDDGSGDESWRLNTVSNQIVVSGIYLALIEDLDTGESIIRKFTIIR